MDGHLLFILHLRFSLSLCLSYFLCGIAMSSMLAKRRPLGRLISLYL